MIIILQGTLRDLGFLPGMLDEDNPKLAREQLDAGYSHGGGWHPDMGVENWSVVKGFTLYSNRYHESYRARAVIYLPLTGEMVIVAEHDFVGIISPGRDIEVARMN